MFDKLKQLRRIATLVGKTTRSLESSNDLAAVRSWLKSLIKTAEALLLSYVAAHKTLDSAHP